MQTTRAQAIPGLREPDIVPVATGDLSGDRVLADAILTLNNAHVRELSWLDQAGLTQLVEQAFMVRRIGAVDAFLLSLDQDAHYDSPNFLWFRTRYPHFVYIDRIVVSTAARGRGYARALYHDLFAAASRAGHRCVVCEVNTNPPNPASDAFHAALGFAEVGTATIHGGTRSVRYLSRGLHPLPAA